MAHARPALHGRGVSIAVRADADPGGATRAEAMIARAEAACARYLQAASEPGLGTLALRKRRDNWRAMVRVLARLRAQGADSGR